jgi:hypothetical protein
MSSSGYYYDPVSNYKVDWFKADQYLKEFKCNCMARYIDNTLVKNMLKGVRLEEQMNDLLDVTYENSRNINLLNNICDELCSGFQTLSVDYNMLKIQLDELKNI